MKPAVEIPQSTPSQSREPSGLSRVASAEPAGDAFGQPLAQPVSTATALRCRGCGQSAVESVLNLGLMPLANDLCLGRADLQKQARYPLELVFCPDCTLAQITETIDPSVLFGKYLYFSSFSDTMLEHARGLAARMVAERKLGADSLVIELASNDGYLLKSYVKAEVPVLGIEPARNVAKVAIDAGVPTLCDFFDETLGAPLASEGRRADVIHAHNVLAHVADTNGFVKGIAHVLQPDGVAVIEVPYIADLLDGCEFDTIYHEHLCYFSLSSLDQLFSRNGLTVRDVERLDIHGGSLRIFADRRPERRRSLAFERLLAEERARGLHRPETYRGFGEKVRRLRLELKAMLDEIKAAGHSIAAYGAAAKGSTLLNAIDAGPELIDFVVDRSPHKQGKLMPGSGIPILAPEALEAQRPDYCLILTWNFADEILRQQAGYRAKGGRFILPIPHPLVIEGELEPLA